MEGEGEREKGRRRRRVVVVMVVGSSYDTIDGVKLVESSDKRGLELDHLASDV